MPDAKDTQTIAVVTAFLKLIDRSEGMLDFRRIADNAGVHFAYLEAAIHTVRNGHSPEAHFAPSDLRKLAAIARHISSAVPFEVEYKLNTDETWDYDPERLAELHQHMRYAAAKHLGCKLMEEGILTFTEYTPTAEEGMANPKAWDHFRIKRFRAAVYVLKP